MSGVQCFVFTKKFESNFNKNFDAVGDVCVCVFFYANIYSI